MLTGAAVLRLQPSDDAEAVMELHQGDQFSMLDNSLGWAWGYAGAGRRVGYVRAKDVGLPR
ncbi:MAG: hypothetical protein ABI626_00455 [Sphingomicrobium sp.]